MQELSRKKTYAKKKVNVPKIMMVAFFALIIMMLASVLAVKGYDREVPEKNLPYEEVEMQASPNQE